MANFNYDQLPYTPRERPSVDPAPFSMPASCFACALLRWFFVDSIRFAAVRRPEHLADQRQAIVRG
jgi:hypothetical protein